MSDTTVRPEIYRETMGAERFGIVQKPLTTFESSTIKAGYASCSC